MKAITLLVLILIYPISSHATGRPSGDPERLANELPDYHQYEAEITEIIDADTIRVKIHLLPGLEYQINVRSKGVDAPEIWRPKCEQEKKLGIEARQAIAKRFPVGSWVYIENLQNDSFGGRIVADIKQRYANQRWRTVTQALLQREGEWGVPFERENKHDWCKELKTHG